MKNIENIASYIRFLVIRIDPAITKLGMLLQNKIVSKNIYK